MIDALEKSIHIKSPLLGCGTKTVNNLGQVGIANGNIIVSINLSIAIDVLVFDITHTVLAKCLNRAVVNFFLRSKETLGNKYLVGAAVVKKLRGLLGKK